MTRRLLSLALLCYLGLATWMLMDRFVVWGDGLSVVVSDVVGSNAFRFRASCMGGCTATEDGVFLAVTALFFACTPLAVVALAGARHERMRPGTTLAQAGFLLQSASVMISLPALAGFIVATAFAESVFSVVFALLGLAVSNVAFGVPALSAWRRLQATASAAQRPILGVR
jgi:hypothetical protein